MSNGWTREAGTRRDLPANRIRSVLIVGGGTAGWMAAAALAKFLDPMDVSIRLVESGEIGTVGVGEATLPSILDFVRQLGIDEDALVRDIKATFKLGIGYRDWTRQGDFYFHPFGPTGAGMGAVGFPSYWLNMFLKGRAARLEEYSMQAMAAVQGKFTRPVHASGNPLNKIAYALHFDAHLFARYLRGVATAAGVVQTHGTVRDVVLEPENGFIQSITLASGERIAADLYIDCSGFAGVMIEGALRTGYEDWSHWLPCDAAVVAQSGPCAAPSPYTLVTAREAGWQWRIPLQHRTGNGYVYSNAFIDRMRATETLLGAIDGAPQTDPLHLTFHPGRRRKAWNRNCVALGLAAGFLEPLEATSIHLIQRGIAMLTKFFPDREFEQADTDRYNKLMDFEFGRVRDFLLMHYTHTERIGAFWEHCRSIPLTDSLKEKIELFKSHGRILREDSELFPVQSWLSVMVGQNILPRRHDPVSDTLDPAKVEAKLEEIRRAVKRCADDMPPHADYIAAHCAA